MDHCACAWTSESEGSNSVSKLDAYPMPRIDDLIDLLGKAKYISTLDLTQGYWQVPLAEDARLKTVFVTPSGFYHFNVMPFGLKVSTGQFPAVDGWCHARIGWYVCSIQ